MSHAGVDAVVKTGHAAIQVDDAGENTILLRGGEDQAITEKQIARVIESFDAGDVLLLQNEFNDVPAMINAAAARGLKICLNPAPMSPDVMDWPLGRVSLLIVNETEGEALCCEADPWEMLPKLMAMSGGEVIRLLGGQLAWIW